MHMVAHAVTHKQQSSPQHEEALLITYGLPTGPSCMRVHAHPRSMLCAAATCTSCWNNMCPGNLSGRWLLLMVSSGLVTTYGYHMICSMQGGSHGQGQGLT